MSVEAQLARKVEERYEGWRPPIVPPPEGPEAGAIRQPDGSGLLRYVYGSNERGRYLEYYSFHRIWGDSHRRFYADGEEEHLDTLETMYVTSGDPEEDRRTVKAMHDRNRRLLQELEEAGLLSGGPVPNSFTINAALVTGVVDPPEPHG